MLSVSSRSVADRRFRNHGLPPRAEWELPDLPARRGSFGTQNGGDIESGDAATGEPGARRSNHSKQQNQSCRRPRTDWLRPIDQGFEKTPGKLGSGYSGYRAGPNHQQSPPQEHGTESERSRAQS